MPLVDHFRLPHRRGRRWESFHTAWTTVIATRLNQGLLPPNYVASPTASVGRLEIDVATQQAPGDVPTNGAAGGPAAWVPPAPVATGVIDFAHLDTFEIQIMDEYDFRLVAAVELVSPANKDRATHRRAFVSKCASYLNQGVGLLVVDIITERSGNLHGELMALFPQVPAPHTAPDELYAAAYRTLGAAEQSRIELWAERLTVGAPLPTMPLWLADDHPIPVPLEETYMATRQALLML